MISVLVGKKKKNKISSNSRRQPLAARTLGGYTAVVVHCYDLSNLPINYMLQDLPEQLSHSTDQEIPRYELKGSLQCSLR
jgi:hypothetical protein